MPSDVREATHAGSWYTSSPSQLKSELEEYLSRVHPLEGLHYDPPVQDAKAVIAPHAGYSYSGPAAAWAYASIPTSKMNRVFLLGPSHHAYIDGVALSSFKAYGTPLGDIPLDLKTIEELRKTGLFKSMSSSVDEEEHSLEMHLPYIRHIFAGRNDLQLVPILVGHPSARLLIDLSKALESYWNDPGTFFVISSDFCHWGTRFSCTPYYPTAPDPPHPVPPVPTVEPHAASWEPPQLERRFSRLGETPIWKSIQYMDHEGIELLKRPAEEGALEMWEAYLDETKNTICGRNPITVLVSLVQHIYLKQPAAAKPAFTFVRYEQSSKVLSPRDSSVSYVSGVLRVPQ
ncbi:hypothetical protein JCM24511_07904 [Saitozyma sp. JCM 24511]|nr:hypothetical protein JCM24511_07904 [Saitozyma sp. JCM 24511]